MDQWRSEYAGSSIQGSGPKPIPDKTNIKQIFRYSHSPDDQQKNCWKKETVKKFIFFAYHYNYKQKISRIKYRSMLKIRQIIMYFVDLCNIRGDSSSVYSNNHPRFWLVQQINRKFYEKEDAFSFNEGITDLDKLFNFIAGHIINREG